MEWCICGPYKAEFSRTFPECFTKYKKATYLLVHKYQRVFIFLRRHCKVLSRWSSWENGPTDSAVFLLKFSICQKNIVFDLYIFLEDSAPPPPDSAPDAGGGGVTAGPPLPQDFELSRLATTPVGYQHRGRRASHAAGVALCEGPCGAQEDGGHWTASCPSPPPPESTWVSHFENKPSLVRHGARHS